MHSRTIATTIMVIVLASMVLPPSALASSHSTVAPELSVFTYTVQSGDSLSLIAQRLLGNASLWTQIWEANRNRVMANGLSFTSPSLIYPGWELVIPGSASVASVPAEAASTTAAGRPAPATYTVVSGDSLWSIASLALSDPSLWRLLWQANQGRSMPDGSVFSDPAFIQVGWTLFLPSAQGAESTATAAAVYAVGENGTILVTVDGGLTWSPRSSGDRPCSPRRRGGLAHCSLGSWRGRSYLIYI